MNLSSYTLVITYFIASLGYLCVSLVDGVGAPFAIGTAGLAALSLIFNMRERKAVRDSLWNALALSVFVFFVLDYFVISGSLITSAARFITLLLTLKLFGLRKNLDYLLVFTLVFFLIIGAAASTVSVLFFVILILFIFSGIWAMIMFTLRKDWQESSRKEIPTVEFGWPFFFSIIAASAGSVAIIFLMFFTLPRMGFGLHDKKPEKALRTIGFSDSVDLGSIAPLKTDPTIVMRFETGKTTPEGFYLKGSTLDSYNGTAWSRRVLREKLLRKGPDGRFTLSAADSRTRPLDIFLEPLETGYIFSPAGVAAVKGGFDHLWSDGAGGLHLPSPPYERIEYTVWPQDLTAEKEPVDRQYLDASYMEKSPEGSRIRELVSNIVKDKATELSKAKALQEFLHANYRYTLDVKNGGKTPLEDFLFRTKEGYCEHYATAMALMLRLAGIPSRVANGYLQGEWNEVGGYYIVRQSDAHSWVEANINGVWMTFDPTPPSILPPSRASELFLYFDYLRLRWNRHIIHFNIDDQKNMTENIGGRASKLYSLLKSSLSVFRSSAAKAVLFGLLLAGSVLFLAMRKAQRERVWAKTPGFYVEMIRVLKRGGIQKRPDETPLEFARRLGSPEVNLITRAYHEQRYGGCGVDKALTEEIKRAIAGLKRNLPPKGAPQGGKALAEAELK